MKLRRIFLTSIIFTSLAVFASLILRAAPSGELYWENPSEVTSIDSRFPRTITDSEFMYVFFEEVDRKNEKLWITLIKRKENELKWNEAKRIAGPFDYSGSEVPDIFSVAKSNDQKRIALSIQTSKNSIGVYTSGDKCETFSKKEFSEPVKSLVGPRIFGTSTGGFMMFVSLGETADAKSNTAQNAENSANTENTEEQTTIAAENAIGSFSILSSTSDDGEDWTKLEEFAPTAGIRNPFVPYLEKYSENGKEGDIVFFQGFAKSSSVFQLFMTKSFDRQKNWSEAKAMTVHPQYRNQRPMLFTTELHDENAETSPFDSSVFAEESTTFNFDSEEESHSENAIENKNEVTSAKSQKKTFVTWERTETRSDKSQIMFAEISEDGELSDIVEITTASTGGSAHRPILFKYAGKLSIVWFDDRKGVDGIYMSQRTGKFWSEKNLVSMKQNSEFAHPIILGDELVFAWQQATGKESTGRIYVLETDRSVQKPKIAATSFREGSRSTSEKASAKVILPSDSSGIAGYTWIWTRDRLAEPPKDTEKLTKAKSVNISANATEDGLWYFKARAYDFAGNWSESATLTYHRDLTPPQPPVIEPVETDSYGFVKSTNFSVTWKNDELDDDVAGYSWNLTPIGRFESSLNVNKTHPMRLSQSAAEKKVAEIILKYTSPKELKKWEKISRPPRKLMGKNTKASYKNPENGVYIFSVSAIDNVGNIGEPAQSILIFNKYAPSTKVFNVTQKTDEYGTITIGITGLGFLYEGTISEITVESKDKKNRYDFSLKNGDYKVVSDEKISGIRLTDMKAGQYNVTIKHSDRGKETWSGQLHVTQSGTVRHENRYFFEPKWRFFSEETRRFIIGEKELPILLILLLASIMLIASAKGLMNTAKESIITRDEIMAIVTGGEMPMEKQQKLIKIRMSLKWKLVAFTSILIISIVTIVSITLGKRLSATQERTLLVGLKDRVNVVMESISSGVRNYLPEAADRSNEIMLLPTETKYFEEANYATITGLPLNAGNTNIDFVWASNDPNIESKIDTDELRQGVSRLKIQDEHIFGKTNATNEEAVAQVLEISERMEIIRAEKANADEERNSQLNVQLAELRSEIDSKLNDLSVDAQGSYPPFSVEKLDRAQNKYIFYKPVLFRQSGDNETFVRAMVMMEVTTDNVKTEIDKAIREIVIITLIVALVAIALGNAVALAAATVIVKPINKLVAHVKKIGSTKNKEELEGQRVEIKSRDEIRTLGDAVNDMTEGLVEAAKTEKELARQQEENIKERERTAKAQEDAAREKERAAEATAQAQAIQEQMLRAQEADLKNKLMESDGRRIQTGFIPLNTVPRSDVKDTIASFKNDDIDLFCYYEGSDSLSGDYFSYKDLGDGWYSVMKCDVSGHGVPASLLTTILATGFNGYFGNWTYKKNGTRLNELALSLNEAIGNLNLRGKFATLLIALFDSKHDTIYLCHAGDNIVRMYDSEKNCQKTITLAEAGAAGAIKRELYEMVGKDYSTAYQVVKMPFKKNDILFLYTDGIEESQSKYKDKDFNNILKGKDSNEFEYEEFGNDRIKAVLETFFKKQKYVLKRTHPQDKNEHLEFDFANCSSDISELIMALASIEKVFRFYKKPNAVGKVTKDATGNGRMEGNVVRVDRRIDSFLKRTFNKYDFYCADRSDIGEQNYLYYLNLDEDKQEDDLTIYAIKNL
ncbi:MAG: SpoIIE family protein phosphatase [Treponema sp.]|nr:SpoIIE family protein phosphatase [Treponema sp.]